MKILKILVEIDGYKVPERSVIVADTDNTREYIEANIIPQMNNPVYAGHEMYIIVYVIDGATEHALIPLPIARYDWARQDFSNEAREMCCEEFYDKGSTQK